MRVVKVAEIAGSPAPVRFEALQEVLQPDGLQLEVERRACSSLEEFQSQFLESQKNFDFIRIGSPFCDKVMENVKVQPFSARNLASVDCYNRENGVFVPRSILFEVLLREIQREGSLLDLESSIFIVGSGATCRVCIAALSQAGFRDFQITDRNEDRAHALIDSIRRVNVSARFQFVPTNKITLLPGVNTLMINTTPMIQQNQIISELYYFNFLKPNGRVWDFNLAPFRTPLIQEAEQIGVQTWNGLEIATEFETTWVQKSFGVSLRKENFKEVCERLIK